MKPLENYPPRDMKALPTATRRANLLNALNVASDPGTLFMTVFNRSQRGLSLLVNIISSSDMSHAAWLNSDIVCSLAAYITA